MRKSEKKKGRVTAVVASIIGGLAVVATVMGNLKTVGDGIESFWHMLFGSKPPTPITLTLTQVSAREINFFGGLSNLLIKFTVDREGQDDASLSCLGEGVRDNVNMTDSGQHFKSVKSGRPDFITITGAGSQSFTLFLAPVETEDLPTPRKLNFRINCSQQKSPWIPVEVALLPESTNPFVDQH